MYTHTHNERETSAQRAPTKAQTQALTRICAFIFDQVNRPNLSSHKRRPCHAHVPKLGRGRSSRMEPACGRTKTQ
eukprot:4727716-Alexandrium_andersonii.AAC.1